MALTLSQLQSVKADIISKGATVYDGSTFDIWRANSRLDKIAEYYNAIASPAVDLWKPDITIDEITNQIVMADFQGLPQGRRDAWFAMSQALYIDATQSLVRTNFVSIFGNGTATLTNVTAIAKKQATNLEALFTTNNVSEVYKYLISQDEILLATRS